LRLGAEEPLDRVGQLRGHVLLRCRGRAGGVRRGFVGVLGDLRKRWPWARGAVAAAGFLFGAVPELEVFGVALLPSSVTLPSVGPGSDSVVAAAGVSVGDVPELEGVGVALWRTSVPLQ